MTENGMAVWDFTTYEGHGNCFDKDILIETLEKHTKKWGFQKEKCPTTGNEHFQGRFSLYKKARLSEIPFAIGNYSITSTGNRRGAAFYKYTTKEFSRIDGPWTDKDEKPQPPTKQMKIFSEYELRPYQKMMIEEATKFDLRTINLIWDTTGNCGKSMIGEYMESLGIAEEIPPFRMMDDIFQWVYSRGNQNGFKPCYLVDMPRGMKKDRLGDFYSGIEVIKNGVAYDKRHYAKKARFDRPRIFIFTNTLPNFDLMSHDRWCVWQINEDFSVTVLDNNGGR